MKRPLSRRADGRTRQGGPVVAGCADRPRVKRPVDVPCAAGHKRCKGPRPTESPATRGPAPPAGPPRPFLLVAATVVVVLGARPLSRPCRHVRLSAPPPSARPDVGGCPGKVVCPLTPRLRLCRSSVAVPRRVLRTRLGAEAGRRVTIGQQVVAVLRQVYTLGRLPGLDVVAEQARRCLRVASPCRWRRRSEDVFAGGGGSVAPEDTSPAPVALASTPSRPKASLGRRLGRALNGLSEESGSKTPSHEPRRPARREELKAPVAGLSLLPRFLKQRKRGALVERRSRPPFVVLKRSQGVFAAP